MFVTAIIGAIPGETRSLLNRRRRIRFTVDVITSKRSTVRCTSMYFSHIPQRIGARTEYVLRAHSVFGRND